MALAATFSAVSNTYLTTGMLLYDMVTLYLFTRPRAIARATITTAPELKMVIISGAWR